MSKKSVIEWYTKRNWNNEKNYKTKFYNFEFFKTDSNKIDWKTLFAIVKQKFMLKINLNRWTI